MSEPKLTKPDFQQKSFEKGKKSVEQYFKSDEGKDGILMHLLKKGLKILVSPITLSVTIYTGATAATAEFINILGRDFVAKKIGSDKVIVNAPAEWAAKESRALFNKCFGFLTGTVKEPIRSCYEIYFDKSLGEVSVLRRPTPSPQPYPSFQRILPINSIAPPAA